MANDELGFTGLRPYGRPLRIQYYQVNSGVNLFRFQPVSLNNSGQVTVAPIADNAVILGSLIGFVDTNQAALPDNLNDLNQAGFLDSSNNALAAVADHPDQLYVLEEDTGGTLIGSANSSGYNVNYIYTATTGNTNTGVSNALLDRSTIATGTGPNFVIVRPHREWVNADGTLNDVTGNFAKWIVKVYRPYAGNGAAYTQAGLPS